MTRYQLAQLHQAYMMLQYPGLVGNYRGGLKLLRDLIDGAEQEHAAEDAHHDESCPINVEAA